MKQWLIAGMLFFAVSLTSIYFIFERPTDFTEGEVVKESGLSIGGMKLLGDTWRKYPNYNVGLGVCAGFSLAGGLYSFYNLNNLAKREDTEE